MKLILSTHNVTLTKAIEDHVVVRLDKLDRLSKRVVAARVTLDHDHTRIPSKQFCCSVLISVRGPDLFAEASESDLYVGIDKVMKKIEMQVRKRHEKVKVRTHKQAARGKQRLKDKDTGN